MDTILYNMLYTVLQWNTVEYSATVEDTVEYSASQCYSGIYECQNSGNDPLKKGLPLWGFMTIYGSTHLFLLLYFILQTITINYNYNYKLQAI